MNGSLYSTLRYLMARTTQAGLAVKFLVFVLVGALFLHACKHQPDVIEPDPWPVGPGGGGGGGGDDEEPCEPSIIYFQQQVLPILVSNCAVPGCHNVPTDDNDDIQITSYATLMNSGIVQDGDFWEVITDNDPDDRMPPPPQAPLSADQLQIISAWLQQGAQNTSCENTGCDTTNVTYSGSIVPIVQQYCQGCHSGGQPQGGLNLTSQSVLQTLANDGRLAASIQHLPGAIPMPPGGPQNKLSDCRIQKFLIWIGQGAPNN